MNIRDLRLSDLPMVTDIYNYYVLNTAVTFDTAPFTPKQRMHWLSAFKPNTSHQCLVAEREKDDSTTRAAEPRILGYASSAQFRPKPAYHSSVETTIYLHPDAVGHGIGKLLYDQLLSNLRDLELHRAYGIIALPNHASIQLHKNLGFQEIGILTEVGHKFGQYHDTLWLEKKFNESASS